MPKLSEFLFGKKAKVKKAKTVTPGQEELMRLIEEGLSKGEGAFSDIFGKFNQGEFDKGVTEPALKNFQENILPMIQEKFVAGNQAGGSGLRNAQFKAGTDLQSQLAQLMYQAQQQQKQNRSGGLQTALGTKAFENLYQPSQAGAIPAFLQGVSGRAGEGVGQGISNAFSGGSGGGGGGQSTLGNMALNSAKAAVVG